MEGAGVQVKLTNQEWKVYLDTRRKKDYQVVRAAWIGDYLDPSDFMEQYLSDAGESNFMGYANKDYDDLLKQAANEIDPKKRMEEFQKAEATFLHDEPIIPIYHYVNVHMISKKVAGWHNNLLGYNLERYLSLN